MMTGRYSMPAIMFASLMSTAATAGPLWKDVEAGMTAEQVRTLYPDAKQRSDRTEVKDTCRCLTAPAMCASCIRPGL